MTSHEHIGVSNHRQLHCLLIRLLSCTSKKIPKPALLALSSRFLLQSTSNAESDSMSICHNAKMHWQHSRLIPMYNARFILWPPSLSSPIRKNFFLVMGRERRWPRWIKKALHIGIKQLWLTGSSASRNPEVEYLNITMTSHSFMTAPQITANSSVCSKTGQQQ